MTILEDLMAESYAYGLWAAVVINSGVFVLFILSFLKPRKRWEWRSMGAFSAFTVALFTEMFGFPLTIYILISVLGSRYPVINPFSHMNGNLWAVFSGGSTLVSGLLMLFGGVVMIGGLIIVGIAWRQIHKANGELVMSGLYRWVRHPQYFGLFLITAGFLIQWPTVITIAMWPILMLMYYRLACAEEKEIGTKFEARYTEYKQRVPMLVPLVNR